MSRSFQTYPKPTPQSAAEASWEASLFWVQVRSRWFGSDEAEALRQVKLCTGLIEWCRQRSQE